MDVTAATQTTGFLAWINSYGSLVAFFVQIIYYIGMVVLIGYAVFQYKRWVNFQLGTGRSGQLRTGEHAPAAEEKAAIAVEDFVE